MEALQSLALKQAFMNERNKIDPEGLYSFGPGFSFSVVGFDYSRYYKEDEDSKILRRFYGVMVLCGCGKLYINNEESKTNHFDLFHTKRSYNYDSDSDNSDTYYDRVEALEIYYDTYYNDYYSDLEEYDYSQIEFSDIDYSEYIPI